MVISLSINVLLNVKFSIATLFFDAILFIIVEIIFLTFGITLFFWFTKKDVIT